MNENQVIVCAIFGVPIAVCVIARLAGASRWISVLVALVPATALTSFFTVIGPILRAPSGERYSTEERIAYGIVFQLLLLSLAAWLVKKKPIQPPQTTTGSSAPDRV
jgi:hypothetical protein